MTWLGELVAVGIGVLLALWTQQWVETRKRRALERRYVASLREDVEADLELLGAMQERLELFNEAVREVLDVAEGRTLELDRPEDFLRAVFLSYNVENFHPTTTTIDELKATADFHALTNREPLRAVLAYHRRVEMSDRVTPFVLDRMWNGLWQELKLHMDRYLFPASIASFYRTGEVSLDSLILDARTASGMSMSAAESVTEASFDLAAMRESPSLRGHLVDALEIHEFLRGEFGQFQRLCHETLARFPTG